MTPQAQAIANARAELADIETDAAQGVLPAETRRKVLHCGGALRKVWSGDADLDDLRADLDTIEILRDTPDLSSAALNEIHTELRRKIDALSILRADPRSGPIPIPEQPRPVPDEVQANTNNRGKNKTAEGIGHDPRPPRTRT